MIKKWSTEQEEKSLQKLRNPVAKDAHWPHLQPTFLLLERLDGAWVVHHCGDLVFSRLTKFLKSNCKLAARVSNYCGAVRVSSRVPCCLKSTSLGRSAKRNTTCLRSACRLYPPTPTPPHTARPFLPPLLVSNHPRLLSWWRAGGRRIKWRETEGVRDWHVVPFSSWITDSEWAAGKSGKWQFLNGAIITRIDLRIDQMPSSTFLLHGLTDEGLTTNTQLKD